MVATGECDSNVLKFCSLQDEVPVDVSSLAVDIVQLVDDNEDVVVDRDLCDGALNPIVESKAGREFDIVPDRGVPAGINKQDVFLPCFGDSRKDAAFSDSTFPGQWHIVTAFESIHDMVRFRPWNVSDAFNRGLNPV